jgi:lipoprotein-anchoring transpeptidase ErfK/SrfK
MKFGRLVSLAGLVGSAILLCSCEELPPQVQQPLSAILPMPKPAGWWNDEGAPGSPRIVVHIHEQKAYFYKGKHLVGLSTVSTGKPGFSTPPGHYKVVSKDRDHYSSQFGDYVDKYGDVVKSNIDVRKDRRPPGTHFDPAQMPYCMHFNGGYAMHEGYVPPYAASHGCIRLPKGMAAHFYNAAPEGTPVIVKE